MNFTTKATIIGFKSFNDTIEGQKYDSTTVFVETDIEPGNGRNTKGGGRFSQAFTWGDSKNGDSFQGKTFPLQVEIDMTMTSNGRAVRERITAIRFLGQQQKVA